MYKSKTKPNSSNNSTKQQIKQQQQPIQKQTQIKIRICLADVVVLAYAFIPIRITLPHTHIPSYVSSFMRNCIICVERNAHHTKTHIYKHADTRKHIFCIFEALKPSRTIPYQGLMYYMKYIYYNNYFILSFSSKVLLDNVEVYFLFCLNLSVHLFVNYVF